MIISPPFLPVRGANDSESQWLDTAMPAPTSRLPDTRAPEGSFPLSHSLSWHNGVHIQAPQAHADDLPVRAIADGKVVFVGKPTASNTNVDDAQNYNPFGIVGDKKAAWTDNGCIIIEHSTSIGAAGATETNVVFYSLYMHLSAVGRNTIAQRVWKVGDRIWRKDEVGTPGKVYGHGGQIHFEICLNAANLQQLIGRAPNWIAPGRLPAPTADGRTDSIFGSLYFYLPASTPTDAGVSRPTGGISQARGSNLGSPLWVKMIYDKGACTFESYDESGNLVGSTPTTASVEYDLYQDATARHNTLSATQQATSSPSGWYELLRFGRNIGRGSAATDKDPLPNNAAHWRRIVGPVGTQLWADLNAQNSFKFSDADFPPVMGWNCIDDDTSPNDQRCDSGNIKSLICDPDPNKANRMETSELSRRLGNVAVQRKLRRAICKFPSEWDKASIGSRYAFVKEYESFKQNPDAWTNLQAHLKAISFDGLPATYLAADWRMHPREFIERMRACGWLSINEMTQCIPRNSPAGLVPIATARTRINSWYTAINKMANKFSLDSKIRLTHLLAHVWAETGYLRITREAGADNARYAPYIGRGLIQITWQDKYEKYNSFAKLTSDGNASFNIEIIATDAYHAGNSSGFYWVSKYFKEPRYASTSNLSRIADCGADTDSIGRLCLWINGGGNHYDHRHAHFFYIDRVLNDTPITLSTPPQTIETKTFNTMDFDRESRTKNNRSERVIVGTRQSTTRMTITIDHTPQR